MKFYQNLAWSSLIQTTFQIQELFTQTTKIFFANKFKLFLAKLVHKEVLFFELIEPWTLINYSSISFLLVFQFILEEDKVILDLEIQSIFVMPRMISLIRTILICFCYVNINIKTQINHLVHFLKVNLFYIHKHQKSVPS